MYKNSQTQLRIKIAIQKSRPHEPPCWHLGSQLQKKLLKPATLLPSRGTKSVTSYAAELHRQDRTKLD